MVIVRGGGGRGGEKQGKANGINSTVRDSKLKALLLGHPVSGRWKSRRN